MSAGQRTAVVPRQRRSPDRNPHGPMATGVLKQQTMGLVEAGKLLGIGRSKCYELAKNGQFPVPVLRFGEHLRVRTVHVVKLLAGEPVGSSMTVGEWLTRWVSGRRKIQPSTLRSYEGHIRLYLIPGLGHLMLDELSVAHLTDFYDIVAEENELLAAARRHPDHAIRAVVAGRGRAGGPLKSTTLHRINATLRAALYAAMPDHLVCNPAVFVELSPQEDVRARLWTDERVEHWRATGRVASPVMVWTPQHLAHFLDSITAHPWYALYHLYAYTGLRRGEGCGLRRTELNLASATLSVLWQIVQLGWEPLHTHPKTIASMDTVALDRDTVSVLSAHLERQARAERACQTPWPVTGLVFTAPDGEPIHPAEVTRRFRQLSDAAGLPPIRLHDLRRTHGAVAMAAGASLKELQQRLRHANFFITADLYAHLVPELSRHVAQKAADRIPRRDLGSRKAPRGQARSNNSSHWG